ncbi:MAG: fibronectin type III domain-containing protein [Clostridia bacterium]|nr:fibronectin type III domain-containing protein [Clostridia bacterium]
MKKIFISIVIVSAVLARMMCINVIAEDYGWKTRYAGDINSDRSEFYAKFGDNGPVFDGDRALYAKYPASKADGLYAEARCDIESMPDGNYTVEFYYKGGRLTSGTDKINIVISGQEYIPGDFTRENAVSPNGDSWYKYSMVLENYTSCDNNYIAFRFNGPINDEVAIDAVSVKDEEGSEMLFDGGFEYAGGNGFASDEPYNTTPYQANDLMASYGGLSLTWKNPSSTELNKISVYDITDGEEILLTDELPITPEEAVFYQPGNLQAGMSHNYKIVFSYDTKEDYVYYMSASHGSGTETVRNFGSAWNVQIYYYEGGIGPAYTVMDEAEKYSGKQSLKLISNINRNYIELKENCYVRPYQYPALEPYTRYRMNVMVKSENLGSDGFCMRAGWGGANKSFQLSSSDWTLHEFEFETGADPSENNNIQITLSAPCTAVWLDDWTLYKLDADGNTEGENLILDSGFEEYEVSHETGTVDNLSADDVTENSARIEWESNGANSKVNIYQKVFDKYEYRGFMNSNITSVELTNLTAGREYTYMIVPQNEDGIEGQGREITFVTKSVPYIIGDTKMYVGNEETDMISGAGDYRIVTEVQNLEYSDGMPYTQLAAVYKDNALVSLAEKAEIIKQTDKGAAFKRVISTVSIPDNDDGYTIEVFIFDSLKNRNILRDCKIFN